LQLLSKPRGDNFSELFGIVKVGDILDLDDSVPRHSDFCTFFLFLAGEFIGGRASRAILSKKLTLWSHWSHVLCILILKFHKSIIHTRHIEDESIGSTEVTIYKEDQVIVEKLGLLVVVFILNNAVPAESLAWCVAGCTVCLEVISAAAGTGACMTCMVRTVLTIHVRQTQVHLPKLPLSATKASLANLLLHHHPSGATQNISNVPKIQRNTKEVVQTESVTVAMKI